jgi:hypothetical protein
MDIQFDDAHPTSICQTITPGEILSPFDAPSDAMNRVRTEFMSCKSSQASICKLTRHHSANSFGGDMSVANGADIFVALLHPHQGDFHCDGEQTLLFRFECIFQSGRIFELNVVESVAIKLVDTSGKCVTSQYSDVPPSSVALSGSSSGSSSSSSNGNGSNGSNNFAKNGVVRLSCSSSKFGHLLVSIDGAMVQVRRLFQLSDLLVDASMLSLSMNVAHSPISILSSTLVETLVDNVECVFLAVAFKQLAIGPHQMLFYDYTRVDGNVSGSGLSYTGSTTSALGAYTCATPKPGVVSLYGSRCRFPGVVVGLDKNGYAWMYMQRAISLDFPGPAYPVGFVLIQTVQPYHETEDELDRIVIPRGKEDGTNDQDQSTPLTVGSIDIEAPLLYTSIISEESIWAKKRHFSPVGCTNWGPLRRMNTLNLLKFARQLGEESNIITGADCSNQDAEEMLPIKPSQSGSRNKVAKRSFVGDASFVADGPSDVGGKDEKTPITVQLMPVPRRISHGDYINKLHSQLKVSTLDGHFMEFFGFARAPILTYKL